MKRELGIPVIISALLLSLGLGSGLWFVGSAIDNRDVKGVTVLGSASISATADTALWTLYLSESAPNVSDSVENLIAELAALRKYLIDGGITEDQITVSGLSTNQDYGQDGPINSYTASLSVRIRSTDVQLISNLNRDIDKLLVTGVSINTTSPDYYVSNLADLRPQAQEAAVKDAKTRAQAMAKALGGEIGDPISISSGSVTVTPPDTIEGEYGGYDLTTIEKSIRAVVTVTFEVD